jgi:predicted esterase
MNPESHNIKTQKTARYFTLGNANENTKVLYLALHGYGQQAERLIKKFDELGDETFIVAPEGLSRFYWNEKTGQTGASWMTKDDREAEIDDYCNYIQAVYDIFINKVSETTKIVLLGFSQGGATAMRWLLLNRPERIDSVQLWGCDIPPELDYKNAADYLKSKTLYWIYGDADPYLGADRVQQLENRFRQFQLSPEIIVFNGGHEVDREVLSELHGYLSDVRI